MALVAGTDLEQHLKSRAQRAKFLRRLRQLPVAGGGACLSAVPKLITDNRRWMWLTYSNVDRYFTGWKYFQIAEGFVDDEPEVQPDGSTAEVTMCAYRRRRCSVGDETHQRLSNQGDKSGSRATTYINPLIVRSGCRKVESQKHITSYIIVNGEDEVGPFTAIFDTSCNEEEDRQINVGWTAGLPRVRCQYGFDDVVVCEPIVIVTPKGGTCEDALEKILEMTIIPLYPDLSYNWIKDDDGEYIGGPICHRLDGGPGRTGQASLPFRMRMLEKGNCTAACQEPDQLFGPYKEKGDDVTDVIVSERIAARAREEESLRTTKSFTRDGVTYKHKKDLTKVELTNTDLPRIVNGRPDDPPEMRPFSYSFTKLKVQGARDKVGAVPLTRAALRNSKVRKELDTTDTPGGTVAKVVAAHAKNMAACEKLGLNTDVLKVSLPRRYEMDVVAPPTSEEDIIRKLVDGKCSQTNMWINCGAVAFNAAVVNKAGCAIIQNSLDTKLDSANSKLAAFRELQTSARSILSNMRDQQIVAYDDLSAGQPKTLVRFYHVAKGEAGIAKYSKVSEQIEFLNELPEETFEELLMLDTPVGFQAPAEVESVAAQQLKSMSDSTRRTIENNATAERDV
eukprot:6092623-Prymnesium_polylepis.1